MTSPNSQVSSRPVAVGVVGSGFIATGLIALLGSTPDLRVHRILTRRPLDAVRGVDPRLLTNSLNELVDRSDVVVECSGDVLHAADVVKAAFAANKPVVTMAAEFHVTVGSYFVGRGSLSEAEGDQPGAIAALNEEALGAGFKPIVFGNFKGFLNHDPTPEEMKHWSERNGISLSQVTSFTDGTKIQIEQALVANGLGASIAARSMIGPRDVALTEAANTLGSAAKQLGMPIADYVLSREMPPGVFIVAEHPSATREAMRYFKMGEGPFYTLVRPYHLCHLEIPRTIRRILEERPRLLDNSLKPTINVAAIAKCNMPAGTVIEEGIGSFQVRGEAVTFREDPNALPIGLLKHARLVRAVKRGQALEWSDVELPDSTALEAAIALRSLTTSQSQ